MALSEERWQRLMDLFHTALDLPAEQRPEFLDAETGSDRELRAQLEGMLAHESAAGNRLLDVIGGVAATALPGNPWIGRRFGPYRIVREIGRGGMGIVFEAERDDHQYRKRVALKIAPGWQDPEIVEERFRRERQILAELEHPHIARFLDGGAEQGLPYFAMELVEGTPITEHCRSLRLTIRQRVDLFLQVCSAVHYAHQGLVIHRDIKPSNILVSPDGFPKLLDFGVAKILEDRGAESGAATGPMLWTPDYASPEQVRGSSVTTRTDVYALGLLLFEMLTGERGQVADTSTPLALDHSICETELPPASRTAVRRGDRDAARLLEGDLDTILAKATRKEPAQRYESVAGLMEDLRRYLNGEVVRARPATLAYRATKFLRRNRLAVTAGVVLAVSIAAGITATLQQARRAERRFQDVRALANAFVFDVHDRIQNLPGSTEARKAIVSTALRYLESLRQGAFGDVALQLELAAGYERIGDVQGNPERSNLGDTQGAAVSYERARAILEELERKGDTRARRPLATTLASLGLVRGFLGDSKAAAAHYARASSLIQAAAGADPKNQRVLADAVEIHSRAVRVSFDTRDVAAAARESQQATAMARRLVELDPSPASRAALASACVGQGSAEMGAGKPDAAAAAFRQGVALREVLAREAPADANAQRLLMVAHGSLADVLGVMTGMNLGDLRGAVEELGKAEQIARWLVAQDPADSKARFDLASVKLRLGSVAIDTPGQAEAGVRWLDEAHSIFAKMAAGDPGNSRLRYHIVYVDRRAGEGLAILGRSHDAARRLEAARTGALALSSSMEAKIAKTNLALASLALAEIQIPLNPEAALGFADEAEQTLQANSASIPVWSRAAMTSRLGAVYLKLHHRDQGIHLLEQAASAWRSLKPPPALEERRTSELHKIEAMVAPVPSLK